MTDPSSFHHTQSHKSNLIRNRGARLDVKLRRSPAGDDQGDGASSAQTATAVSSVPHDPPTIGDGRSRSAQRWMKLRTTVQLTSAITSTVAQSKKQSLKREDSFIARFSTRQIPEAQVKKLFWLFQSGFNWLFVSSYKKKEMTRREKAQKSRRKRQN